MSVQDKRPWESHPQVLHPSESFQTPLTLIRPFSAMQESILDWLEALVVVPRPQADTIKRRARVNRAFFMPK